MNEIVLKDCLPLQWYEVVEGLGLIKKGDTVQYINTIKGHFVIAESHIEERGVFLTNEEAEIVKVKRLSF